MSFGVPECSSRLDERTRVGVANAVCIGNDCSRLHPLDKATGQSPSRCPKA
jgi:hypothetical protein